jgi:hypothetical protein
VKSNYSSLYMAKQSSHTVHTSYLSACSPMLKVPIKEFRHVKPKTYQGKGSKLGTSILLSNFTESSKLCFLIQGRIGLAELALLLIVDEVCLNAPLSSFMYRVSQSSDTYYEASSLVWHLKSV